MIEIMQINSEEHGSNASGAPLSRDSNATHLHGSCLIHGVAQVASQGTLVVNVCDTVMAMY
jgi:hypothetical protein